MGYKFTVRVNRDILFEAPYDPCWRTRSDYPGSRNSGSEPQLLYSL